MKILIHFWRPLFGVLLSVAPGHVLAVNIKAAVVSPTFADRYDYAGCTENFSNVAAADVSGDGVPDLVCSSTFFVSTLLGNGDGTFRAGPSSNLGVESVGYIVLVDLNGDGKTDLIAQSQPNVVGPAGFVVSLGNGDGTFQPATYYSAGSDRFGFNVVTGDFNGDGILDFASESESGIWLYTGKGGGLFNPGVLTVVSGTGGIPDPLAAVDVNGDGKLDIIASINRGFTVLLGNGNGTFGPQMDTLPPLAPVAFATGDLNGDGRPDLFLVNDNYSGGLVYLNNGNGTFTLARQVNIGSEPNAVAIADVNGDGFLDIVSAGSDIMFGNGKGYFSAPVFYPIASNGNAQYVLPFDLRNNGRTDLVFLNYFGGVSVLLNGGKGVFLDGEKEAISGGSAYCAVSADFNVDGKPDLAVGVTGGISIMLGTGNYLSPYTQGQLLALASGDCPVEGDLNGDGIMDLLITSTSNTAVAYLGNGDGTFTQVGKTTPVAANGTLVLGDFNGDGKLDFALSSNLLAYGNGDGTFQTPAPFIPQVMGNNIVGIAAARLNGDRETDIVLTDFVANLVYVLLSNGKSGFTQTTINSLTTSNCFGPYTPVLADVNGDGHKELLLDCSGSSPIYLNNGSGGFTYSGVAFGAGVPLVADVNGDGIADVVIGNGSDLAIYPGEGSMLFAPPISIGAGASPGPPLAVDAHGQRASSGKPDLITPDASGVVNVFLNTTK